MDAGEEVEPQLVEPVLPEIEGAVEAVGPDRVAGWVWARAQPDTHLVVSISINGNIIQEVLADQFRQDLLSRSIGDGYHAFSAILHDLHLTVEDVVICRVDEYFYEIPTVCSVIDKLTKSDENVVGVESVTRGKNGWIFLVNGTNSVLNYYTDPEWFSDSALVQWLNLLKARRQRSLELKAKYVHMVAPEKMTVYHEYFDDILPYLDRSPTARLSTAITGTELESEVINVLPFFEQQKKLYKLYWKTDTHWTFEGCYSAYQLLCDRLDYE